MSGSSERRELEHLRDAVGDLIGFGFEQERLEQLGAAVRGRVSELGMSGLDEYIARLRAPQHRAVEVPALAALITVTETFFYRSYDQVRAFIELVVPAQLARRGEQLKVLSVGCASGEEPYTLAIALVEAFPNVGAWDLAIAGMDVNQGMLKKALSGRYSAWSLRSTPDAIRERYFQRIGTDYQLSREIMNMVVFKEQNLAEQGAWPFETFGADAVFCRNVIMYFSPDVMRRVVAKVTHSLSPGGHLFLGHAETLRGLSHDYHLCHTHNTFYYQKRSEPADTTLREPMRGAPEREQNPPLESIPGTTSWFEAIQAASRRVSEMADLHDSSPKGPTKLEELRPAPSPAPQRLLTQVLELVTRERFSEALALLEAMPADTTAHPDALLLSAVLLTNNGKIADAERACGKLLDVDDLNAGAHYLKALCREHAGDDSGAAEHDRIAMHLDPSFSMPRLHAGLLAKRGGDRLAARRELAQALVLLEREEAARLVLFGGGFSRDALTTLCRTELARLGEARR